MEADGAIRDGADSLNRRMGRLWKFRKDEVDERVKSGGAAESDPQNPGTGKK